MQVKIELVVKDGSYDSSTPNDTLDAILSILKHEGWLKILTAQVEESNLILL